MTRKPNVLWITAVNQRPNLDRRAAEGLSPIASMARPGGTARGARVSGAPNDPDTRGF